MNLSLKCWPKDHGNNIKEMARQLVGHPLFIAAKNEDVVYQYIYHVIKKRQNGVTHENRSSNLRTHPSQSRFEQIVNKVSLRLPVGAADQIARLIRVLRAEWSLLEQEAIKARQLEFKVREFERHRCPDANQELRDENKRLTERITFLESRVAALSNLTAPRTITDKHLAIGGR